MQYDGINIAKGDLGMLGYVLANFFVYAGVNAFTPGPGNILALNTMTNYGWGKGKPLFFGIFARYYAVQLICAVFVYGVGEFLLHALPVMKYIGAAYILWLAVHIAVSRPEVSVQSRDRLRSGRDSCCSLSMSRSICSALRR